MSEGPVSRTLGRAQGWLQGHPTKTRPYAVDRGKWLTRLGNLISSARYWYWRARGGPHDLNPEQEQAITRAIQQGLVELRLLNNTTTNQSDFWIGADNCSWTGEKPKP